MKRMQRRKLCGRVGAMRISKELKYGVIHFPRDGIWDHMNFGHDWKVNSLNCLHVWPQFNSDFSLFSFTILSSHSFSSSSPQGNLSSLWSKELTRNRWNYCYLDLPPWAGYQHTPSSTTALCMQSVCAVYKDLTSGHYPFREYHALTAFPWTSGSCRTVKI